METLRTILLMIGSLFIRGLERRIPLSERLRFSYEDYASRVEESYDSAENHGAKARLMADDLSTAKAELRQLNESMKRALAKNNERAAASYARRIAQMNQFVSRLQGMVDASFGQWEEVRAIVQSATDKLEDIKYDDRMLEMRDHAAEAMKILNQLAMQTFSFIPSVKGVAGIRERAKREVEEKEARVWARGQLVQDFAARKGVEYGGVTTGVMSEDAQQILDAAKRELGLMPREVPTPAVAAPAEAKKLEVRKEQ